ncbi:ATP-binding protein [Vibrio sp. PP-XX7]
MQKYPKSTVNSTALQQVWVNLISNAIDALPEQDGQLEIYTHLEARENKPYVCVTIRDHGMGIPDDMQAHIFKLNFTTKERRSLRSGDWAFSLSANYSATQGMDSS